MKETEEIDSTGTWDETVAITGTSAIPLSRSSELPVTSVLSRRRRWHKAILLFLLLAIAILVGLWWQGTSRKIASNGELSMEQRLRAVATAQQQYCLKYGCYAGSGQALMNAGHYISADFSAAFEQWQNNGDAATPQPKAGYCYRMLQGRAFSGPQCYWRSPQTSSAGMTHFGVTARAAEPWVSGEYQYFMTGDGRINRHQEPLADEMGHKTFLLDAVPDMYLSNGTIDEAWLARAGWVRCPP